MRQALSLLTPFGGARAPGPRTAEWFPFVGMALGLALGAVWWGGDRVWRGPAVPAALVVLADLIGTGMLHFDGLVDCADGLLSHLAPARRLEVMSSPEVGAFGVAAGAVVLLIRFAALDTMPAGVLLLAGIWGLSRAGMAVVIRTQPYARSQGGLATALLGPPRWALVGIGVAGSVALLVGWNRTAAGPVALAVAAGAALVVWAARRRIGGYTGDVLGAAGVVGETVGLIVASARW